VTVLRKSFLAAARIRAAGFAITTISVARFLDRRDLEGIVAKRKRGVYKNNGLGWKKIKNPKYSQAEGRHDLFTRVKK
jgi:ATP-dependent DNA ligase